MTLEETTEAGSVVVSAVTVVGVDKVEVVVDLILRNVVDVIDTTKFIDVLHIGQIVTNVVEEVISRVHVT
jgi:hypothetical protein